MQGKNVKRKIHSLTHGVVGYAVLMAVGAANLFGTVAKAADSTITVKGEVYAEPCTVASASTSLTMDFGKVSAKGLQTAKSASSWLSQDSTISLTGCPAGTKTVKARFDGAADADNGSVFKNAGTAANVGIWLAISGDGMAITPGSTRSAAVTDSAASFKLGGKLYSEKGGVTAGTVSATISVTLSYE